MTANEAFTLGLVWGGIARTVAQEGWKITIPSYGSDDPEAPAVVMVKTPSGTELLISVTETRTPPEP